MIQQAAHDEPPATWTEERVALMAELWGNGLSAAAVGARIGFTRNAVIGKLKRLGISDRGKSAAAARAESGRKQGAANIIPLARATRAYTSPAVSRAVPKAADAAPALAQPRHEPQPTRAPLPPPRIPEGLPPAPTSAPITINDLTARTCRWPIDPDAEHGWRFCGGPRDPASPQYCTHHHARVLDTAGRHRFLARRR